MNGSIRQFSTHYNDFNPVFSTDGNYLFFLSNRKFDPTFCDFEWEMVYKKMTGIYCAALRKDVPSMHSGDSPAASGVSIDFGGLQDRIEEMKPEAGNYRNLSLTARGAFYTNRDEGDFNRFEFRVPATMDLCFYDFEEGEEEYLAKNINGYSLSADGSNLIYRQDDKLVSIDLDEEEDYEKSDFDLSDLTMWYEPRKEWKQIFEEAWRMERDYYYEPNMQGVDWPAMRKRSR